MEDKIERLQAIARKSSNFERRWRALDIIESRLDKREAQLESYKQTKH